MMLFIDPPVQAFSTADEIRAWQRVLARMRDQYRNDPEALRCIARAERDAAHLLELAPPPSSATGAETTGL